MKYLLCCTDIVSCGGRHWLKQNTQACVFPIYSKTYIISIQDLYIIHTQSNISHSWERIATDTYNKPIRKAMKQHNATNCKAQQFTTDNQTKKVCITILQKFENLFIEQGVQEISQRHQLKSYARLLIVCLMRNSFFFEPRFGEMI